MNSILVGFLVTALALIVPYGLLFMIRQKRRVPKTDENFIESREELAQAEQEVRDLKINYQEQLLQTHRFFDRFASVNFSRSYMDQLVQYLQDRGVNSEYIFLPSGPLGYGASIIEPQGLFELYIEKSNFGAGSRLIEEFRNK